MPNQTLNGNSFEYAVCTELPNEIISWCNFHSLPESQISIMNSQRFELIKEKWEQTSLQLKNHMLRAARAGIRIILDMEPRLLYATINDKVFISVSDDQMGENGDVRDLVIIRNIPVSHRRRLDYEVNPDEGWQIGISCKWNHFALKHSRLSNRIDFGLKWFGYACSEQYWQELSVPLLYLNQHLGENFSSIPQKEERVYQPFLNAFIQELLRLNSAHNDIPRKMVQYLIGRFDFYKLIGINKDHRTEIQAFNLRGLLNQEDNNHPANITLPNDTGRFPNSLIDIRWKENSRNTIYIFMDRGWQFEFRIHNADRKIIPSLKLDINLIGSPMQTWTKAWDD